REGRAGLPDDGAGCVRVRGRAPGAVAGRVGDLGGAGGSARVGRVPDGRDVPAGEPGAVGFGSKSPCRAPAVMTRLLRPGLIVLSLSLAPEVRSQPSAPQAVSASVVTVAASSTPGSFLSAIPADPTTAFTEPGTPKPAYLVPVRPAPFGVPIMRIANNPGLPTTPVSGTWGSDARHVYSKQQPWNAAETLLSIENRDGGSPSPPILDAPTYQPTAGPRGNYNQDPYPRHPVTLALSPHAMPSGSYRCAGTAAAGFTYSLGHADLALNPYDNHEDVLVGQDECHLNGQTINGTLISHVMMVRLRDAKITALTDPNNEAYAHHISTRSLDRPGWAYVDYFQEDGKRFSDEVIAVKLDGSRAVQRFACKHSVFTSPPLASECYRCESHAAPSMDGRRILFASNWAEHCGASCGSISDIKDYVIDARVSLP